jgi:hypothetical protein|tara:strand:+ start:281 stop:520 length:240 start_codon:yes stop_codon:yes gene_type:complete
MKLKSIYQRLVEPVRSELQASARQYDSAKRLKYKLMSSTMWHELTISEISSLMTYSSLYTHEISASDIMYGGSKFLTNE